MEAGCCIAGGGPAGVMLGYLLARAGVQTVVLEKHVDFFRDFRGDTIHPSTLQILDELGLLDDFLKVKHNEVRELSVRIGGTELRVADFRLIPGRCKFVALMPQWDFLNFLAERGRQLATFRLEMQAEVTDLLFDGDTIAGVQAKTPSGTLEVRAPLVIAADGRGSILRERAQMRPREYGVPVDALWFRLPRQPGDPNDAFGNITAGGILVMFDRGDYFQCAFVIPKGGFDRIRERGLDELRRQIVALSPFLADRVGALRTFDDVKLLTIAVNRLPVWFRPGLLFIGDSAHAMSPVGGVGVNLAIQDAVAAANLLAEPLRTDTLRLLDLRAVQGRREFPTKFIQGLQIFVHQHVLSEVLNMTQPLTPPLILRILNASALLRNIPAYIIGIGPRPEHVSLPRAVAIEG